MGTLTISEERRYQDHDETIDPLIDLLHRAASGTGDLDLIYEGLDALAKRFSLEDALVAANNETLGRQVFRLEHRPIGLSHLEQMPENGALITVPDVVSFSAKDLMVGITEVVLTIEVARRTMLRDPLTGLMTRGVFNEALRSAAAQASRYGWSCTMAIIRVNEVEDGPRDLRLRRLGRAFGNALRNGDAGASLSATTFAALLANAQSESVTTLVRRFARTAGLPPETITAAAAICPQETVDPAELFRLANLRLRDAQHEDKSGHRQATE